VNPTGIPSCVSTFGDGACVAPVCSVETTCEPDPVITGGILNSMHCRDSSQPHQDDHEQPPAPSSCVAYHKHLLISHLSRVTGIDTGFELLQCFGDEFAVILIHEYPLAFPSEATLSRKHFNLTSLAYNSLCHYRPTDHRKKCENALGQRRICRIGKAAQSVTNRPQSRRHEESP